MTAIIGFAGNSMTAIIGFAGNSPNVYMGTYALMNGYPTRSIH
jgi:hypothetical protein